MKLDISTLPPGDYRLTVMENGGYAIEPDVGEFIPSGAPTLSDIQGKLVSYGTGGSADGGTAKINDEPFVVYVGGPERENERG